MYLASFVLIPALMLLYAHYVGINWFVGMLGTILALNVIMQGAYYFAFPKTLARLASNLSQDGAEVEATADGIRVSSGQNVNSFPWKTFKYVWIYDDFVILVIGIPLANRFLHIPTAGLTEEVRASIESAATQAVA